MKVCICGAAGGIGQPLSLLMKNSLPDGTTLSLYDIVNTAGVAADLSHINTAVKVIAFQGQEKLLDALKDSDVVVIPAGVPRKPGMSRDDLFNINAGIVKTLVEGVVKACPQAFVCIITNPVNSTVPIAASVLENAGVFDAKKLFGVTTLDIVRSSTFVAELKGLKPDVTVHCVGGHSGNTILPLLSQVEGTQWTPEEQDALVKRIQNAGTEVVEAKAGAGSATLSMAFAGSRFVQSLVRALKGEKGIVECSYVKVENDKTEFFSYPIELGVNGVEKILPIGTLNALEQKIYDDMIKVLQENIKTGRDFVSSKL